MSRRKMVFVLLFMVLPLRYACDIFPPSNTELKTLDSDIRFRITEGHPEYGKIDEPVAMLMMMTEKEYGCCNWSLASRITTKRRSINVNFVGILVPEICLTAIGPASSVSVLDISPGEYGLTFSHRNVTDVYRLEVTVSSFQITKENSEFTSPQTDLFWRYPKNSFVYLCGTTTETSWLCADFLDSLKSKINIDEFHFPEAGEIPYPRASSGHYYDMPAKYFTYQTDADFDRAEEMLRAYKQNVIKDQPGIGISLINWKSKYFYSWLF